MIDKIQKVRDRGYIVAGMVRSLTGYFPVPKGDTDIRMVYDATACGLNAALWSPNFFLPTIDSVLRNADSSTWFGDIDLGEMFLNYFLDEAVRPWAGVDVRVVSKAKESERWERCLMGLRPSPYICTQTFGWGEALIWGDRRSSSNPLRWDRVVLNLPGSEDYDPKMSWVYKWDDVNSCLASFFGTYIDDVRNGGATEKACWAVARRVASRCNYLGQQDAARKRRPPSRTPGAWAGASCLSNDLGLFVTCTQKKWDKARGIVLGWQEECHRQSGGDDASWEFLVDRKRLERETGFLVHISRTFPAMFPYLKSLYHTLNSWRTGRCEEGWKWTNRQWKEAFEMDASLKGYEVEAHRRHHTAAHDLKAPDMVKSVRGFREDISALAALVDSTTPVHRLVRGSKSRSVKFGFGDASGAGFGSSWTGEGGEILFRSGVWGSEMDESSSNLRELRNLVETLELMGERGELKGVEMFLFTDNSTAESAFYKGSSSSKSLYDLVLRLRKLEMREQCKIHIFHVAGTRMIAQGSDGLSRGDLTEGVMTGGSMKSFVPTHLGALERSPIVKDWILEWAGASAEFLSPEGWFHRGHGLSDNDLEVIEGGEGGLPQVTERVLEFSSEGLNWPKLQTGQFIWTPPPAAAGAAVEELRKARHKDVRSSHVFVVPRLMQPLWRKQLYKAADLVIELPAGHKVWPSSMHEPLTLAFCFPYLPYRPWELRRSPLMLEVGRHLRTLFEDHQDAEGPVLRELWSLPSRLAGMSEGVARKVLHCEQGYPLSHRPTRKRRRSSVDQAEG